jgi:hypothetical protein
MKKVILLFLALLAQGEDLHLKLSELPSAPEVNWLTTNEVAMQMATSGRQVKLASENSEWSGLSDLPVVTATEWTTEEEILRMVNRRQVNLAYNGDQPQPGFPNKLGIGSWEVLRDYIVAKRGMGIGIWLTLQYYDTTGDYHQIRIGKQIDGYESFVAMLVDSEKGFEILIGQLIQKTDYKEGSEVWAQISITYFNDRPEVVGKPFGLSLPRPQGTKDTLNSKKIVESFLSSDPSRDMEVMVAPFPSIKKFELQLSLTNNIVAIMTWTKESGVQLASWPKEFPEKIKEQYIAISGWLCYGVNRMRMTVSTVNGEETYTEHGDRLSMPMVISFEDWNTMVFAGPKGGDFWIWKTTDLANWNLVGVVTDVNTGRVPIGFSNDGGRMVIFRAGVK